jgi:2'-5' RNA ligase
LLLLRPPPPLARLIEHDMIWLGPRQRVPVWLLHITLVALEDWPFHPHQLFEMLKKICDRIRFPLFRVVLDELRGGHRTVLLRPTETLTALNCFQQLLVMELARAGIAARANYRFSPHLTLRHIGNTELVEPTDVSWQVEEFLLVESLIGETRHEEHGRWPLG